jgi:hypothetical protein
MDPVNSVPLCEHGDDAAACQLRHPTVAKSQETICDEHKAQYFYSGYEAGKRDALEETQPGPARLPTLAQIVGDATKVLNAAIFMLGRDWDQATGPSDLDDPWGPEAVDISLSGAVADIRSALRELAAIPTMSSARWDTTSASLPGGPFNHPVRRPGEGLTPGLDDARLVARTDGSDAALGRPPAGSSHLAPTSSGASGGLSPGLADAAGHPTAGGTGGSEAAAPGPDAGESSDPRPVARSAGPDGPRREAGVGFTLPQAKAFDIRQTISDAYARQRRFRRPR